MSSSDVDEIVSTVTFEVDQMLEVRINIKNFIRINIMLQDNLLTYDYIFLI